MSEIYKTHDDSLYFVSFSVVAWMNVFIRIQYQEILINSILHCQKHKGLLIYAYCIMPSHVHMIAATQKGKLSSVLRDMKSYSAKLLMQEIEDNPKESRRNWLMNQFQFYGKHTSQQQEKQFWRHENHAFELHSNEMIQQKVDYIHQNPVVAGFVDEDWKWRLSSANPGSPIKVLEL